MPASTITDDGLKAGNYLVNARNVAGGAVAHMYIATLNGAYILTLRDECIAFGLPPDDPRIVALNTAHYRSSDFIETFGNLQSVLLLEDSGRDVIAAAEWLIAQPPLPLTVPPPPPPEEPPA